jgi:hypothetical protein
MPDPAIHGLLRQEMDTCLNLSRISCGEFRTRDQDKAALS